MPIRENLCPSLLIVRVNQTSSDFCRKSFDCRRNVWACSISFSNRLISFRATGQPCFSKSSIMDGLLSRNDGTLSSGYLKVGQNLKQTYISPGLNAMLSLCYRNGISINIYYHSNWYQNLAYCTPHVFEIDLNIYVPRARKKVKSHCPRLVQFPSAQVPFHCQLPDVKVVRQVVCHPKGKLKFTFLLEPWFDSTVRKRLKIKVMKGCNLLQ